MRNAAIGLLIGLIAGAGGIWLSIKDHSHGLELKPAPAEEETSSLTRWTDRTEVFLEHPEIEPGKPAEFLAHVTDLATGAPRTAGAITYIFMPGPVEITDPRPARPGIYRTAVTLPREGHWGLKVRVDAETVDLGELHAHGPGDRHDHAHEAEEGIRFLKEQQWRLGMRAELVGRRTLVQRLRVPGVVTARPGSRAALTAPVEGRLVPPPGRSLPGLGETVNAGQVLGLVQPPFSDFLSKMIEAEAEVARTRVALEQADAAAQRMRKLAAEKARSERELADAEYALRTAGANAEAAKSLRAVGSPGTELEFAL